MGKACVILFALAAAAYAEGDPWYGYGLGYGYGLPYYGGYALASPCKNAAGVPVPCALGRKKREAEAEPWFGYGYGLGYAAPVVGAAVAVKPCTNVNGEKVGCALGHKDVATAHIVPALWGRKKREADPVYFRNVAAEVTEHEGKHIVPQIGYAAGVYGYPVATYATAEVPYKYSTVEYKNAPVENPTNPDQPELVHTSQLGVCLNAYGFQVPC